MNFERYRFQAIEEENKKKGRQSWEDCWVDLAGQVNKQDHNIVQPLALQRSRVEQATVQDKMEANRLLQQVKRKSGQATRTFSSPTEERLALIR